MNRSLSSLFLALLFAAGCSTTPSKVVLCSAVVRNETPRELRDFRIVHIPTQRVLAGNLLLPGKEFLLGLDRYEGSATAATVSWTDPALGRRETTLALPSRTGPSGPQRLIYALQSSGQATVVLAPCP